MTLSKINPLEMVNIEEKPVTAFVNCEAKWVAVKFGTDVSIMGKLTDIKNTVVLVQFDGAKMSIARTRCEVVECP